MSFFTGAAWQKTIVTWVRYGQVMEPDASTRPYGIGWANPAGWRQQK
jgi:hypothetical protein